MRDRWVKFADRRPPVFAKYLYLAESAEPWSPLYGMGWYDPESGRWSMIPAYWESAITHWMFLPGFPYEVRARARLADRNQELADADQGPQMPAVRQPTGTGDPAGEG